MASSPQYASNVPNCAVQRDVEMAQPQLDVTTSNWSQARAETSGSAEAERELSSDAPPPPPRRPTGRGDRFERELDDAASYLQVVVEKHRRRRAVAAAQTSPRLPSASSPLAYAQLNRETGGGGDRGVYVLPHPVLLACPTGSPLCKALQTHNFYTRGATVRGSDPLSAAAGTTTPAAPPHQKKDKSWKIFRDSSTDNLYDDGNNNEPERVEVYYFEQSAGAWLATSGGARPPWLERAALAAAGPLALALGVQRALLVLARGAVTGALQTSSDYALKPALALTYNALLQPLLVFALNVSRGVRAALRPLAAALGDALEPLARVLAAVRLVDVRVACDCERRVRL